MPAVQLLSFSRVCYNQRSVNQPMLLLCTGMTRTQIADWVGALREGSTHRWPRWHPTRNRPHRQASLVLILLVQVHHTDAHEERAPSMDS